MRGNSGLRSLYIALVFATLFVLIIILQILSIETNNNNSSNHLNNNIMKNNGMSGRFKLFSKKSDEKDIFSQKNSDKLENIIDLKYSTHSMNVMLTETNQSNKWDLNFGQIKSDHWQKVPNSGHKFYVFSAYYDNRSLQNRFIRVIAATKTRTNEKVYCKLWYAHTYQAVTVNAINKLIHENWNLKYSAYFILCPLFTHIPVPDAVSLFIGDYHHINEQTLMHSNKLFIHNKFETNSQPIDNQPNAEHIAVCIKPLHYHYNKVLNLIEFIELNRILGVRHFFFYNHTIGADVDCALRQYIDEGFITILSWDLNMESQKEIRTEGLFAALNDCLYRAMNRFKYVLMIDIDELIIPYRHSSLTLMLKTMNKVNGDRTGGYSFRNAFFYTQWPDDTSVANYMEYSLQTLLKTRRKSQLNLHKQRSKCIVIPNRVIEMGNHFVWEFMAPNMMVNVDPRFAALHHYRVCEFGGDDCIKSDSLVERRVHIWRQQLITSVNDFITNRSSQKCHLNYLKTKGRA
ncbi:uncharacterized protein LOC128965498 [Oppia nitens]|uniref:uncharacterized protein LOC128965498 n=1 Tax=Oppia nitens TaxID=1686743 RepID=UPI0023DAEAF7|nr:uncharacterized protein LOC128965498 [Oppia nitens]